MTPVRIFISSVQREFALERERLRDYLRGDPLMRRFFDVFLFEEVPASDRRPGRVYLDEVDRCDIYVGLFGRIFGQAPQRFLISSEIKCAHFHGTEVAKPIPSCCSTSRGWEPGPWT